MSSGKVLGIGGVFLRSTDPARLAAWYRDQLGFNATQSGSPTPDGEWTWEQEGGHTVFAAFAADSDYWQAERQVMLNFRVAGLDDLLDSLAEAGVEASRHEEIEGVGRFARIHDCDGNPIELWEPAG
ncbi:VOC family protein [Alteraurantiacibacter aquimixticola]|uniref:VOC family protein n=1 Tax=Alteraurantiacibacter aquimixticola TaxID=2489173 RepID=A0A4T3EYQ4_9SPHN|nr:VOC family protein [Alteraurantiacibacter aquimixticola]TIX49789.1 VOC family protein [Alteraurantiacibacter aquimixticola]